MRKARKNKGFKDVKKIKGGRITKKGGRITKKGGRITKKGGRITKKGGRKIFDTSTNL